MKIIGYSIDKKLGIFNSLKEHQSESPFMDFLLKDYGDDTIKVFYNLDIDVAGLLGLLQLTKKELEKLADNNRLYIKTKEHVYILTYIPGKWFSIDKDYGNRHPFAGFSDISQYNDKTVLSYGTDEGVLMNALFAKSIGEEVLKGFNELGYKPSNIISPVNVYRKCGIGKLDLPMFDDIPLEAMEIAYECCCGNWVETYKVGHWNKVFDYDINSAYPYQAMNLFDLRKGHWKKNSDYQGGALYGYCRCEVMIDSNFSPIILQLNDENFTPKGVFKRSLTKNQIDFINNSKIGYTTIIDGQWFFPDENKIDGITDYPLEQEVAFLYGMKHYSTGMKRELVKRIMAGSFYGIFIETRDDEFGENFMSPWAAEIETKTQLRIAELVIENKAQNDIINIAVDGVVSSMPLYYKSWKDEESIGHWRLEHTGKCYSVSSGLIAIDTKIGHGDFSIKYDWLSDQIRNNPKAKEFSLSQNSVLSLAQARNLNRIGDLGNIETITKTIHIGDNKRLYEKMPRTFDELNGNEYNSEPWSKDMLDILEDNKEEHDTM